MNTPNAAVFISSNSQAVRLPMQFQLRSQRASISRRGNLIVLRESPLKVRDLIGHLPFVNDTPVDIDDQMPATLPSMDAVR